MRKLKLRKKNQKSTLLAFLLIFGIGGMLLLGLSFASPPNPEGYADYCYLEGGNTVVYGWAHDNDAPAGPNPNVNVRLSTGQTVTVPTDRAGYRDAEISADIRTRGYTSSSVYGFRAVFSGIYKGSSPTISGTVLNYGAGSNAPLAINDFRIVDGNPNNFPGKKIPDACLAAPPVPVVPPPSTPPATPQPVSPTRPAQPRTTPRTTPTTPATPPPAPAAISTDANAAVTPGTLAANVVVPAGNAALIRINYGTTDGSFTLASPEVAVEGDGATITLTGLLPKTTYFYQINRLNADKTITMSAPSLSFTTVGYDVLFTLTDKDKPLAKQQVLVSQLDFKGTTGDNGEVIIHDVPVGTYSLDFTYKGRAYKKDITITIDSNQVENKDVASAAIIKMPINVADLTPTTPTKQNTVKKKSNRLLLLLIPLLVIICGVFIFLLLRRRSRNGKNDVYSVPSSPPLPPPHSPPVQTVHIPAASSVPAPHHIPVPVPQAPANPDHIGESLKHMVIKSMQEAAAAKAAAQQTQPAEPTVIAPVAPQPHHTPHQIPLPEAPANPDHIGESLKHMVIKSMQEAAQKEAELKKKDAPK